MRGTSGAEDSVNNAIRDGQCIARREQAIKQARSAQAAGRGKRRI